MAGYTNDLRQTSNIANGYVKLSKNIKDIMDKTGVAVGENKNQFSKRKQVLI